jgi:hypothetical protein
MKRSQLLEKESIQAQYTHRGKTEVEGETEQKELDSRTPSHLTLVVFILTSDKPSIKEPEASVSSVLI